MGTETDAAVMTAGEIRERLRVLASAIEKMGEAVPEGREHGGKGKNPSKMPYPKAHESMLTALFIAVLPYVKPLELDIPERAYGPSGNCTLVCRWGKEKNSYQGPVTSYQGPGNS